MLLSKLFFSRNVFNEALELKRIATIDFNGVVNFSFKVNGDELFIYEPLKREYINRLTVLESNNRFVLKGEDKFAITIPPRDILSSLFIIDNSEFLKTLINKCNGLIDVKVLNITTLAKDPNKQIGEESVIPIFKKVVFDVDVCKIVVSRRMFQDDYGETIGYYSKVEVKLRNLILTEILEDLSDDRRTKAYWRLISHHLNEKTQDMMLNLEKITRKALKAYHMVLAEK